MIKLKNSNLFSPGFNSALQALMRVRMGVKVGFHIGTIFKRIEKMRKQAAPEYDKLLKDHFKVDEDGKFMLVKDEKGLPVGNGDRFHLKSDAKDANDKFEKERDEFMDIDAEINRRQINLDELVDREGRELEIEPGILADLCDLIVDVDEVAAAPKLKEVK